LCCRLPSSSSPVGRILKIPRKAAASPRPRPTLLFWDGRLYGTKSSYVVPGVTALHQRGVYMQQSLLHLPQLMTDPLLPSTRRRRFTHVAAAEAEPAETCSLLGRNEIPDARPGGRRAGSRAPGAVALVGPKRPTNRRYAPPDPKDERASTPTACCSLDYHVCKKLPSGPASLKQKMSKVCAPPRPIASPPTIPKLCSRAVPPSFLSAGLVITLAAVASFLALATSR
jgi:hypothetical protein